VHDALAYLPEAYVCSFAFPAAAVPCPNAVCGLALASTVQAFGRLAVAPPATANGTSVIAAARAAPTRDERRTTRTGYLLFG
jgi:hypothetical protein